MGQYSLHLQPDVNEKNQRFEQFEVRWLSMLIRLGIVPLFVPCLRCEKLKVTSLSLGIISALFCIEIENNEIPNHIPIY